MKYIDKIANEDKKRVKKTADKRKEELRVNSKKYTVVNFTKKSGKGGNPIKVIMGIVRIFLNRIRKRQEVYTRK